MADNESTSVTKDLGIVSAYGYAKAAGYTGTEEEFEQIFLEFTENAPGLLDRLDDAVDAAEDAETAAVSAKNAAVDAKDAAVAAAATFTTDTTLSVSGKAADAKVTGDEVSALKTAIIQDKDTIATGRTSEVIPLEAGAVSTNINSWAIDSSNNARMRTKSFVDLSRHIQKISISDSYEFFVLLNITKNSKKAPWYLTSTGVSGTAEFVSNVYTVPEIFGTACRIGIKRKDGATITSDDIKNANLTISDVDIVSLVGESYVLKEIAPNIKYENKGISPFYALTNSSLVDLYSVPVDGAKYIKVKLPTYQAFTTFCSCFYDNNDNPVQLISLKNTGEYSGIICILEVPQNASRFDFEWFHDTSTYGNAYCEYATTNKIHDFVLCAASNSNGYLMYQADYCCTGENDEVVIQQALDDAVNKGVPLYLADGDYYIDSFYADESVSESDERFAILIKSTSIQHNVKIAGIHPSSRKNGTVNELIGGAILHVTDTCYSNLSNDYRYRIIMASSNAGTRRYPWSIIDIENVAFTIPDNQKKIIGIDGWYMTALNINNVFGMALSDNVSGNTHTGNVDASTLNIGVDECVGVRGLQGSAYGVDMSWKNSFMWGFGQGFAVCGEHLVGINLGARFCNYGFTFNKFANGTGTYVHPITLINCADEGNFNMPFFGESGTYDKPSGQQGKQPINLIDYNFEWFSDYYALGGDKCEEETAGCAYGAITYTIRSSTTNGVNSVSDALWESGKGDNMKSVNSAHKLKGTTAERLTYAANENQQYWDTDLNKMTFYIGGTWVDASGTAVD